jgi:uncharacterized protein
MAIVWVLAIFGYLGHLCLAIAVINRLHSFAIPRWLLECIDLAWYAVVFLPLLLIWKLDWITYPWHPSETGTWPHVLLGTYFVAGCVCLAIAMATRPAILKHLRDTPQLLSRRETFVDLATNRELIAGCGLTTRLLTSIPGNQVFQIAVAEKSFELPALPEALAGLTITHLSDLHLTGQLPRDFYRRVADLSNELRSDIVAITGDIVEKVPCLDWLPETLGRIQAPLGVFFVLGNHELRIHDTPRVRRALTDLGWTDLGGTAATVIHAGRDILLEGNELPWHRSEANIPPPFAQKNASAPFRILLSHAPDQFAWARNRQVDLMLAGHTHGGQIQLPVLGPVFSPSRYGVKYCAGIFYRDSTLMHVSRGIAGTRPLRFQCPPEIAKLTLCPKKSD